MMAAIVVGVDGSKCAQGALDFAAQEASLRSCGLLVVTVWELPNEVMLSGMRALEVVESARIGAELMVKKAVARVGRLAPSVVVESFVGSGRPEKVLLEKARGATLLVVGSRGRGATAGLLLGSVSQRVIGRADCPVVVVPPTHSGC